MNIFRFFKRLGLLLITIWIGSLIWMVSTFEEMALLYPLILLIGGLVAFPVYFIILYVCRGNQMRLIIIMSIYLSLVLYFSLLHDY